MNEVIVLEDTAILLPNNEHRNFTETDKLISKGTKLKGEFKNIEGLRRGKSFTYRIFQDKDGIILYAKNLHENKENMNGDNSTITLPSEKKLSRNYVMYSVLAGVLGYAIAKKMGKSGKTAFMVAGISAIGGYMIAKQVNKSQPITFENK
jgi:hypothetical protein